MLYSTMCQEDGGIIDDLMVCAIGPERYLLVVNAATRADDWAWISEQAKGADGCTVRDASDEYGLLAIQGPRAVEVLQPLVDQPLPELPYMSHQVMRVAGREARVSRSGYTGEDGFEVMVAAEEAGGVWDAVIAAKAAPIGLGARDTLRLEAGLRLYGSDMDRSTTPYEAGLGWTVKLTDDREFIGEKALRKQKEEGIPRRLAGLVLRAKGVPRAHQTILSGSEEVGETTSGTFSPTRREGIAMGYVSPDHRKAGTEVEIEVRRRRLPAEVVRFPFVPHRTKR
jgi:aminomethyltransferase